MAEVVALHRGLFAGKVRANGDDGWPAQDWGDLQPQVSRAGSRSRIFPACGRMTRSPNVHSRPPAPGRPTAWIQVIVLDHQHGWHQPCLSCLNRVVILAPPCVCHKNVMTPGVGRDIWRRVSVGMGRTALTSQTPRRGLAPRPGSSPTIRCVYRHSLTWPGPRTYVK